MVPIPEWKSLYILQRRDEGETTIPSASIVLMTNDEISGRVRSVIDGGNVIMD